MPTEPDDPFLEAYVEEAVARASGVLSPEALDDLRLVLLLVMGTHPDFAPFWGSGAAVAPAPGAAGASGVVTTPGEPGAPGEASEGRKGR